MTIFDNLIRKFTPNWPIVDESQSKGGHIEFKPSVSIGFSAEIPARNKNLFGPNFLLSWTLPRRTADGSSTIRRTIARICLASFALGASCIFAALELGPLSSISNNWDQVVSSTKVKYGSILSLVLLAAPDILSKTLGHEYFWERIFFRSAAQGPRSKILFFEDRLVCKPGTMSEFVLRRSDNTVAMRFLLPKGASFEDISPVGGPLLGLEFMLGGFSKSAFSPMFEHHDAQAIRMLIGIWYRDQDLFRRAATIMTLLGNESNLFKFCMGRSPIFDFSSITADQNGAIFDNSVGFEWEMLEHISSSQAQVCHIDLEYLEGRSASHTKLSFEQIGKLSNQAEFRVIFGNYKEGSRKKVQEAISAPITTEFEFHSLKKLSSLIHTNKGFLTSSDDFLCLEISDRGARGLSDREKSWSFEAFQTFLHLKLSERG